MNFQKIIFVIVAVACSGIAACARQPPLTPSVPVVVLPPPPPLFSDDERAAIVTYWNAPGRYRIGAPPEASRLGPWVVRLTPDGSTWFLAYRNAVSGGVKVPPTQTARAPRSGPTAGWEAWVQAKWAYDRYQAQGTAQGANLAVFPAVIAPLTSAPPAPGPIPPALLAACGNPPLFVRAYAPMQYTITFDDADSYAYTDNVKMPDRYAYYRFGSGVDVSGVHVASLAKAERDALFQATGFAASEQRIWEAVSALEGGFDAVQTEDTGFVSVGFIQFVTMADGRHDLSHVLLQEKIDQPADFQNDFRRFGIDVRPDQTMVSVDPATGAELGGADAVQKIIDDKRLVAIFQRAGRKTPFRLAQIKVAKADYWPADDPLTVTLRRGGTMTGKVSDVISSEAGIATLLDMKINRGNIRDLTGVVGTVMATHRCRGMSLSEAAPFEREIIAAMKYRADFLKDATLTQPGSGKTVSSKSASNDAERSEAL